MDLPNSTNLKTRHVDPCVRFKTAKQWMFWSLRQVLEICFVHKHGSLLPLYHQHWNSVICFLQNHSRTKTQLNENSKIRNLWEKNGFLQDLLSCLQGCLSFQPENFFQTLRQSSSLVAAELNDCLKLHALYRLLFDDTPLPYKVTSRKPAFFSLTQIRIHPKNCWKVWLYTPPTSPGKK